MAKSNFFCREGTFEVFEPLWTIEDGHRVLAIARNPLSTYVLLNIVDQKTLKPFKHEIKCWAYLGSIIPGWPESPEGVEYDFGDLPVVIPPDLPEEEPEPEKVCSPASSIEDCRAFGGKYNEKTKECVCP